MYNQKVMERFLSQKNLGEIRSANAIGASGTATAGDIIRFYFVIEEGVVVDAKAKVFGCVAAFAVASLACQLVQNKSIEQVLDFDINQIDEMLDGIPEEKKDVLIVAKQAMVETINNYFKKLEK